MNKVVLVTGSGYGLGKSIILKYAENGYDVVINYNKHEKEAFELEEFINNNYKVKTLCVKCDISSEKEVLAMVDKIKNKFNRVDVLVNNSAVEINSDFYSKDYDSFRKVFDVNVIGCFLVSKYIGKLMFDNKSGSIINISSNNAIDKYDPSTMEYDASKSAVISMTHNMAIQFAPYVNVNCVAPGWIRTDKVVELDKSLSGMLIKEESKKILVNRFANTRDIANVVYFLSSDYAKYINSEVIKVDGGSYNG